MALRDFLIRKARLLEFADDLFLNAAVSAEKGILSAALNLLRSFSTRGGRLEADQANATLLLTLRRRILEILEKSDLGKAVDDFLPRFDEVEAVNRDIYDDLLPSFRMPNVSLAKRVAVEKVIRLLKDAGALDANYGLELRRLMFENIERGLTVAEAERRIREFAVGPDKKGGVLSRYVRQVSQDLISGYDGYVQERIREKYKLDGFFYTGTVIRTSRQNCIEMIDGTGAFSVYAIRPGLYPVTAIPAIIEKARQRDGFRKETTVETFGVYRMGYNCRHSIVYVKLTNRERMEYIGRLQQDLKEMELSAADVAP